MIHIIQLLLIQKSRKQILLKTIIVISDTAINNNIRYLKITDI